MLSFRSKIKSSDIDDVRKISKSTGIFDANDVEITAALAEEAFDIQQNPELSDAAHDIRFALAEENGKVCAFICYGKITDSINTYELYWLATHKEHQGKGIGRMLLNYVIEEIKNIGGTKIYLKTDGRPSYTPTRKFYDNCGFELEARLKQYYASNDDCCIYAMNI